jgi:hypothetical protein
MSQDDIREADQEARLEELELIEGIRQLCKKGQHWDAKANACVDDLPPPPPPATLDPIPIIAAASSGVDGANVPGNVFDNSTSTRFSVKGLGSWLTLDLGAMQDIHQIQFTWFMQAGETRTNTVALDFSDLPNPPVPTAGTTTTEHTNHGLTVSVADFGTAPKMARSIIIKLTATSNSGQWFSVTDIKVSGKILNQPPPPPPPPPPGPTNGDVDAFGTKLGYAKDTRPRNNWHMTSANDNRFMESNPKAIGNGWYSYPSLSQGRIEVMSVPGLTEDSFDTFYIDDLIKRGYAYKPVDSVDGDFGDVEVNVKYQNISEGSGSFEAHPETVYSLFRQTNDTKKVGKDLRVIAQCEAGSYHSNVYKARSKFEKDSKHTEGYTVKDPSATNGYGSLGKTGFVHKSVFYRVPNNTIPGGFAVKCEQYISTDGLAGQKFKLLIEYLDDGKWGPSKGGHNSECGCSEYVVHNYGHPTVGLRIDFMQSFEFRDWSITSINPGKKLL